MNEPQVFQRALEIIDESERSSFIHASCGGDHEKANHLIRLVRAHFKAGQFMNRPAALSNSIEGLRAAPTREGPNEPRFVEKVGDRIGSYRLVEEIGQGGMAVVFRATQSDSVEFDVALKVIKPGLESEQILERIRVERQALAMMNHQGIARFLDAGATALGRPYYVMELVTGVPITEFCYINNTRLKDRLKLFVSVCEAVEHAHRKGVIHRDIKPTNILVSVQDKVEQAKVIDFGIAKIVSPTQTLAETLTNIGQVVGTPQYMSPEQASFDNSQVDTRTDIYSLGAVLYELITGRVPVEAETLGQTLQRISNDQPIAPSRIAKNIDRDLETICLQCLKKSPDERYANAGELSDDIQRYLAGRPINARPVGWLSRLSKWSLRSPLAASLSALCTLAVAGLIVSWVVFTWQLSNEKQLAIENFDRAHLAIKKYVDTQRSHTPLGSSRHLIDQKRILETGIDFYNDFLQHNTRNGQLRASSKQLKEVELERADLYYEYGKVLHSAHEDDKAILAYENVKSICEGVLDGQPKDTNAVSLLAKSHNMLAKIHLKLGQYSQANLEARSGLACFEILKTNSETNTDYLRWLEAMSWRRIGKSHLELNQLAQAESAFEKSLLLCSNLERIYDFQLTLSQCYLDRCILYRKKGEIKKGINELEKAISIIEDVCMKSVPTPPRYALARIDYIRELARSYEDIGQRSIAIQHLDHAIELQSDLRLANSEVEQFSIELLGLYRKKYNLLQDSSQKKSLHEKIELLQVQVDQSANDPEQLLIKVRIRMHAADNERIRWNWESAISELEAALELLEKLPDSFKPKTVSQIRNGLHYRLTTMNFKTCQYQQAIHYGSRFEHDTNNPTYQIITELAVSLAFENRINDSREMIQAVDWSSRLATPFHSRRILADMVDITQHSNSIDRKRFASVLNEFKKCCSPKEGQIVSLIKVYDLCRAVDWIESKELDQEFVEPFVSWAKANALAVLKSHDFERHSYPAKYLGVDPRLQCLHSNPGFQEWLATLNPYTQ